MGLFKKMLLHFFKRPAKNWNIENRAFNLLEKQEKTKPAVAPRHPTTVDIYDKIAQEHPELLDLQKQKDENLHDMLKDMVVNPEKAGEIISRSRGHLPEDRKQVVDDEFGYLEPEIIPEGKCSIRQCMKFIVDYKTDPEQYSVECISKDYKLDVEQVKLILKYFQTLDLHIPDTKAIADKTNAKLSSGSKQVDGVVKTSR